MISIDTWQSRGQRIDTPDGRVFVVDTPGEAAVPVLALHGFPTSSWDFAASIEQMAPRRRVVAFDFIGMGLSDKPATHGYSLFEQADIALHVARELGLGRVHLWAHDMGTSVATELLARRERGLLPIEVASFVLMNGSVHIELAHLTFGQQILKSPLGPMFARLNSRATFKAQMRRIFARPPADEELDAMWELVAREDGAARLASIIRYTEERARFRRRWIGALERCDVPALVAWGRRDPVAVMAIAEKLAGEIPGAKFEVWDDLGHYPQVEDPARVAKTVSAFFDACGAAGG
jgi:pimeloyl-ACP methyl ester carboxylesterase